MSTPSTSLLLHPHTYDPAVFDPETRRLLRATIDWFEQRGLDKLASDYHAHTFYADFLAFAAEKKLFATLLTPADEAAGDQGKRWDTARIAALSEILALLRPELLVPLAGHHPRARPGLAERERRGTAAGRRARSTPAAWPRSGCPSRAHGADIYSTDMVLTPDG